jgi:predicted nucleic acid-binding protein
MKVLLDTNIIIHRETSHIINKSIGQLFRLLDKGKYTKCIHPVTIKEIEKNLNLLTVQSFQVKLESYKQLIQTTPIGQEFKFIIEEIDKSQNDFNDSILLNEIYMERIDYFITEDKKIHKKAKLLDIDDKVFTIETFIDKELSEHPELINYKVLSVRKKRFGELNINDVFFDTFKNDYNGYVKWFTRKADEFIYVTYEDNFIASLLYLKEEDHSEDYSNINPVFFPKKRLKIGTFKITRNGARLSERFIKIIFDNALRMKVQEIYVTRKNYSFK